MLNAFKEFIISVNTKMHNELKVDSYLSQPSNQPIIWVLPKYEKSYYKQLISWQYTYSQFKRFVVSLWFTAPTQGTILNVSPKSNIWSF